MSHKEPEAVDLGEGLMREVGAELRQARRQRGQEIEDVAEILRIQPAYLAGLEQGDLSAIPGRTYALGFLRSYAQYLGFDGNDVIAQIRSSGGGLAGGAALQGRAPLTESRLPKLPILVLSLAALAGAYAGWAYVDGNRAATDLVEEVPDDLQEQARPTLVEAGSRAGPLDPALAAAPDAPPVAPGNAHAARPSEPVDAPPPPPEAPVPTPSGSPRAEPQAPAVAPADRATEAALVGHDPAPLPQAAVAPEPHPAQAALDSPTAAAALGERAEPVRQTARATQADPTTRAAQGGQRVPVPALAPASALARAPEPVRAAALAERDPAPTYRTALAPEPQLVEVDPPARDRPRIYGTESAESRVMLRARSSAWLHVSSTNNDYLWVQTLRPGDAFIVPARPDLVLWTGNAGGVEVIVDGAPLPPLGPDAVVVRDVSLQPRALLRRLLPLPAESAGVSDLASAAKPPMMPPSSR